MYFYEALQQLTDRVKEAVSSAAGSKSGSTRVSAGQSGENQSIAPSSGFEVSDTGLTLRSDPLAGQSAAEDAAVDAVSSASPSLSAGKGGQTAAAASGSGSDWAGASASAPNFTALEKELKQQLDHLDERIELAVNRGDLEEAMRLQTEAQNCIASLIAVYEKNGYTEENTAVAKLYNRGYAYAADQDDLYADLLTQLTEALKAAAEAAEDAADLLAKQTAVEQARAALQTAQEQRTVRVFNRQENQWEWQADSRSVSAAQTALEKAEQALASEELSQQLAELLNQAEAGASADELTLGPRLLELLTASGNESSGSLTAAQTQAVRSALAALGSADAAGYSAAESGNSLFASSGDTVTYQFGDITLSEAQAEGMTVAELARQLRALRLGEGD